MHLSLQLADLLVLLLSHSSQFPHLLVSLVVLVLVAFDDHVHLSQFLLDPNLLSLRQFFLDVGTVSLELGGVLLLKLRELLLQVLHLALQSLHAIIRVFSKSDFLVGLL